MKSLKSILANVATNALRHYRSKVGVPVWNPTKGAFYVLRLVAGLPRFLLPTLRTWYALEKAGKRKAPLSVYTGLKVYAPTSLPYDSPTRPRYMVYA